MFGISNLRNIEPSEYRPVTHTLIMHHLSTFLVSFSTLVLKLSFSQSLSLHSRLSLLQADLLEL